MRSYLIIQPNGNYSCWSSISDSLFGIDTKPEDAYKLIRVATGCSEDAAITIAETQIKNIADTGVAEHYAMNWIEMCDFLEGLAESDGGEPNRDAESALEEIKRLDINRYDLTKIPQYKTSKERYYTWMMRYAAKSERLERDAERLNRSVYRLRQRLASLNDKGLED